MVCLALERDKQTQYHAKQRHSFNKSGRDDHRSLDTGSSLGLAGNSLESRATNATDSKTCTKSHQARHRCLHP